MEYGKLMIVATPIGNLGDITLRGLEALRTADVIAAEDTRHTQKLMNHYEIKGKLVSFHEYSKEARFEEIMSLLKAGKQIALVSDAGTPLISDPGYELVRRCVSQGIPVETLPGACAAIAAITLSGMDCSHFLFWGFLSTKQKARREELQKLRSKEMPCILYESPNRVLKTLEDICAVFGEETPVCICRELTKIHEECLRMSARETKTALEKREAIKGEFVLLIGKAEQMERGISEEDILKAVEKKIEEGMSKKSAAAFVAAEYGIAKNKVYSLSIGGKRGEI